MAIKPRLSNSASKWAMLGFVTGLSWAILGYLRLSWAILGYLGLCWAMLGYVGLCWAILGYLGIC